MATISIAVIDGSMDRWSDIDYRIKSITYSSGVCKPLSLQCTIPIQGWDSSCRRLNCPYLHRSSRSLLPRPPSWIFQPRRIGLLHCVRLLWSFSVVGGARTAADDIGCHPVSLSSRRLHGVEKGRSYRVRFHSYDPSALSSEI